MVRQGSGVRGAREHYTIEIVHESRGTLAVNKRRLPAIFGFILTGAFNTLLSKAICPSEKAAVSQGASNAHQSECPFYECRALAGDIFSYP